MRPALLERWVHDVLHRAELLQPTEDSRVELKREWIPDLQKAARRIAAHANAAQGEPILWLIGVDEKSGVVTGADAGELSNWLAGVQKYFDGTHPTLISNLIVDTLGSPVVALLFGTDAAPYVVKTGLSGAVTHEVPWREGNKTRSAGRSDLLRLLARRIHLPEVEIVTGHAWMEGTHVGPNLSDYGSCFQFRLQLYVAPQSTPITIPRHRCTLRLLFESRDVPLLPYSLQLLPPSEPRSDFEKTLAAFDYAGPEDAFLPASLSVQATQSEAIINGPGFLHVHGCVSTRERLERTNDPLILELRLTPVGAELPVEVTVRMQRSSHSLSNKDWWQFP
jgi:hypothetical protein